MDVFLECELWEVETDGKLRIVCNDVLVATEEG